MTAAGMTIDPWLVANSYQRQGAIARNAGDLATALALTDAPRGPLLAFVALAVCVRGYLQAFISIAYDVRRAGNVALE